MDVFHGCNCISLMVEDTCICVMKMYNYHIGLRVIVFNTTFNNISVISWELVLLVEETGVPYSASHWQASSHNVVSSTSHHEHYSNSQLYTFTLYVLHNSTTIRPRWPLDYHNIIIHTWKSQENHRENHAWHFLLYLIYFCESLMWKLQKIKLKKINMLFIFFSRL